MKNGTTNTSKNGVKKPAKKAVKKAAKNAAKKTVKLSVREIVEDTYFLQPSEGGKIRRRMAAALRRGDDVVLSFRGVDPMAIAPPFFNVTIGKLYGTFSERDIRKHLKVTGLNKRDTRLLEITVEECKLYHKDPKAYRKAERAAISDL